MRVLALALLLAGIAFPASLKVSRLAVSQFEDGSPLLEPDAFNPGEHVNFSFVATGFTRKGNKVHVDYYAKAFDPAGVLVAPPVTGEIETSLSDEDKEWAPKLRGGFVLPEDLFRGRYRLVVLVHDELADQVTTETLYFRVSGPEPEKQPGLVVRDLNFYAGDDSTKPLERAAYRIGEQLQARYRIAGFDHTIDNRTDVSYTVSLLDMAGKVLYETSGASQDHAPVFYPKPYIAGVFGLDLKAGTPTGHFILKIVAKDAISGKTAESQAPFAVE